MKSRKRSFAALNRRTCTGTFKCRTTAIALRGGRIRTENNMKKTISIILAALLLCLTAGCAKVGPSGSVQTAAPETTSPASSAPEHRGEVTPEPTASPETTPKPDPEAAEALRIAAEHGLADEDLHGEYGLFRRFSETVEGNSGLGRYKRLVYRIFPVAAAHTEYLDRDYFLERLSELSFMDHELDPGTAGRYFSESNTIQISTDFGESDESQLPAIVFHELMHFLDYSMKDETPSMYLLDGERLTGEELLALPLEDQIRSVIVWDAAPIREGGAELYTAKYFAGSVRSYFNVCSFLTGLELIYGTEKLDELFFSRQSDALFAELFLGAGYTADEYYDAVASLSWLTNPTVNPLPYHYVHAEDILIDLYEHELGDGWQTNENFLYVLKYLNGIAWPGCEDTRHAEFLSGIQFDTWEEYDAFAAKLYSGLTEAPEIRYTPPSPVIIDGRYLLTAYASWTDAETQKQIRGTITAEYDFREERAAGYKLTDMDAILEECFG